MIINASYDIKNSILIHVIIFLSVYLSFYENKVIISKSTNLGIIMINQEKYFNIRSSPFLFEIIIRF